MSERQLAADVPVRPAATVLLIRDRPTSADASPDAANPDGASPGTSPGGGLEVFMLQRSHASTFARSQFVFPGGRVDDADAAAVYEPICDSVTDATASERIGVGSGGLAWLVAGIRECFEEAGILLARKSDETAIVDTDHPSVKAAFEQARREVYDGRRSLADVCNEHDLQLLTDRLFVIDHWVTPVGERRRFDTRFFVTSAPTAQTPIHDDGETIASLWTTAADALARWKAGELQMFPPTVASLEWLSQFRDVAAAIGAAAEMAIPEPVLPKLITDPEGKPTGIVRPGEPGYEGTLDPTYVTGVR